MPLPQYSVIQKIIAVGFIALLTGVFWADHRSSYHSIFYALLALPAAVIFLTSKDTRHAFLGNRAYLIFMGFSAYMLLSIAWSDTNTALASLIKRPLYIALFLIGVLTLIQQSRPHFELILKLCILLAALAAIHGIVTHTLIDGTDRLIGPGTLHNPLLTAHVFGMYAAITLALCTTQDNTRLVMASALIIFLTALIMTGSRTPIVGLIAAVAWLACTKADKRTRLFIACLLLGLAAITLMNPSIVLNRGLSYRPDIWQHALQQISEAPFFGHGFDNSARFFVAELDIAFHDPHNFLLGILHAGGLAGLLPWLLLMGSALLSGWRLRHDTLALAASTALVFGLASSLTEGDSFLSRPKEHWFLIWIPFSILIALSAQPAASRKPENTPPSTTDLS